MDPDKLFRGGRLKYRFLYNSANNYFWFLYMSSRAKGRGHWHARAMGQWYRLRMYGGYHAREALWPIKEAVDAFFNKAPAPEQASASKA